MKRLKTLLNLLVVFVITMTVSSVSGANPFIVGGGLYAASFLPKPNLSMTRMGLDPEIWKPWIVEQLFANNDFLNYCQNADEYVLQGRVVHIPNAGIGSSAKKNRAVLPATVTRRKDIDVTYSLDEYTSDPRLMENADKILSYDKMNSMMGQDMRIIKELAAMGILFSWAPASTKIIGTTGASAATHLSGTTGNRKLFKLEDLEEAAAILSDDNIPDDGNRYTLMTNRMHQQLITQLSVSDYKDFSRAYDPQKNIIGQLFGFKFLKRSASLRASNAKAVYDPDPEVYTAAASDNDVVLCWHIDEVERALGTVTLFERLKDPQFFGDIYSMLIRAGGRRIRNDNKGVVGIVQTNV